MIDHSAGKVRTGLRHGSFHILDALGNRDEDVRPLAAALRTRPDDVGIEERRGERVTSQDDLIGAGRIAGLTCVRIAGQNQDDIRQNPLMRSQGDRSAASDRDSTRPPIGGTGCRAGRLEFRAEQVDKLLLVEFDADGMGSVCLRCCRPAGSGSRR